jgi:hypothetical protein
MKNFLDAIANKKSGTYLIVGSKEEIKCALKYIIENRTNIIAYTLKDNPPQKKEEFEPLWSHISMNWEDNPQTVVMENIEMIPNSIINTLVQHLDKEYEDILFILTTETYEPVAESIKTRAIKFFFEKKIEQNQYEEIINLLINEKTEVTKIDQLIDNINISPNNAVFIAEKILQQISIKKEFEKMKRIKNLLNSGILPETQKHFLRAIYTILHSQ